MKVVMVEVTSLNGLITKGDDPDVSHWASAEDGAHFRRILAGYDIVVLGRTTYQQMQLKPRAGKLRIVMTTTPAKYQHEAGEGLEFTAESPEQIVARLRKDYPDRDVLVGGGSAVYSSFLKAGVVDEVVVTIEPLLFGSGTNVLHTDTFSTELQLQSVQRLNDRGTLLLTYTVCR